MKRLPLSDACLSEVLARVSFRLMHSWVPHYSHSLSDPRPVILEVARELQELGWPVMSTWVMAYAREWSPLTPTPFVRDCFIFRAHQGYSWRRVVYPEYKAHRPDLPVSNTEVRGELELEEKDQ